MLEISIRFLAGRFHATPWGRNPREGEPEWPPSPWRLLRALTSAFYRNPTHFEQDRVVHLLQILSAPPEYHLPEATAAHTRQYFPQAAPGNKQLLFDAFVRVRIDEVARFRWPGVTLEEGDLRLLNQLLEGVTYFGRAESWAELQASPHFTGPPSNCSFAQDPVNTEAVRLLGASAEVQWEHLTCQTGQLQRDGWSLPPGSRWLTFHRSIGCFRSTSVPSRRTYAPIAIRFAYLPPVRPRSANGLFAAETIRTDYLELFKRLAPSFMEAFSGKVGDERAKNHDHPYILPQPDRALPHLVDELILIRKSGFPDDVLGLFAESLGRCQARKCRVHRVQFLELLDEKQLTGLPQFRPAKSWESLTPFVRTRHLKPGKENLLDQVRRELSNHSCRAEMLEGVQELEATIDGIPLHHFRTQRKRHPRPAGFVHNLRLEFAEPIAGPMVLGYGSHFGLGQFRPC